MNNTPVLKISLVILLFLPFIFCNAQRCPQPTDSLFLSLYKSKAQKKVEDFGFMLSVIADKTTDPLDATTAINNAVSLFISEDATVEISGVRDTSYRNKFKIREYLKRVKAIKYDKVEIEWSSIQYVSDLRLGDDGNFHGAISFEQKFKATKEGFIISNWVKKNTLVVVKPQSLPIDGKTFICWEVFLSDIEVSQTLKK